MLTKKFYTFLYLVILTTATMGISATHAYAHSHAMLHDADASAEYHLDEHAESAEDIHLH